MATKGTTKETTSEVEATVSTTKQAETRKVTLPLTRDKQNDVFVGVNGRTWKIKRGVEVEVPETVYRVLKTSEKMDTDAMENIRKHAK